MGIASTETTWEAPDIILVDTNFAPTAEAVMLGPRPASGELRILFLLSSPVAIILHAPCYPFDDLDHIQHANFKIKIKVADRTTPQGQPSSTLITVFVGCAAFQATHIPGLANAISRRPRVSTPSSHNRVLTLIASSVNAEQTLL